jgi:hypothetical protein
MRERFRMGLEEHRRAIDDAARSMDATVVRTTTAEPFEAIVTRALSVGLLRGGVR